MSLVVQRRGDAMLGQGNLGQLALGQPFLQAAIAPVATTVRQAAAVLQQIRVGLYSLQLVRSALPQLYK